MRFAVTLACCLIITAPVTAGKITDASVTKVNGIYDASIDVRIIAPVDTVIRFITDYDNLAVINPSIEESRVLYTYGPDKHRVQSVIKVCILIYCKQVQLVQDVQQQGRTVIEVITLPEYSDFISGVARLHFTEVGQTTEMTFIQRFEPDFWIPPVIGPWLIKRKLMYEVDQTTAIIETAARRERKK